MKKLYLFIFVMSLSNIVFCQGWQVKSNTSGALGKEAQKPTGNNIKTLQWCRDYITHGIGTNSVNTLSGAIELTSTDLTLNRGHHITQVQVGISDPAVITSGRIMIIENPNTAYEKIVVEQEVNFIEGWNNIHLDNPYKIGTIPIFVAYEIVVTGGFPMGFDAGPARSKGDWIRIGTNVWSHLTFSGLSYTNSIKAIIDRSENNPGVNIFRDFGLSDTRINSELETLR